MVFDFLLNILFPPVCAGCRRVGRQICLNCLSELIPARGSICPGCQKEVKQETIHEECRRDTDIDQIISLYMYKGVVRKMLKQAKYQFISVTLKELITNAFATVKPEFEKQSKQDVVLIPIPLHTNRLKWRGFNQAQIIAKIVSQETDIPLLALLKRDKETQPQAQMSTKAQRKENIKNAFTLVSTKHTPTTVILVDDVFTSGATMNEAAKLLKQAGIKKVIGFTLLRGER